MTDAPESSPSIAPLFGSWTILAMVSPTGISYRIYEDTDPPADVCHIAEGWGDEDRARLIAAAPKLLAGLHKIATTYVPPGNAMAAEMRDTARAAAREATDE